MKKILSLLLALTLVFALSACGKNDTSSDIDTGVSSIQMENESNTAGDDTSNTTTENDNNSGADSTVKEESKPSSTENSKPAESCKPTNSTSTPSNSKPTETSKPTNSTTSKDEKPKNSTYSMYVENNDIVNKNRADVLATFIRIEEDSNGKFTASYTVVGYTALNITSISESDKVAVVNSVKNKEAFYDDGTNYGSAGSAALFSWESVLGYQTYPDLTFEKLITLDDVRHHIKNNTLYLPSAFLGESYFVRATNVSCSYNKETGLLQINDDFPMNDLCIGGTQQSGTYKVKGNTYKYVETELW